MYRILKEEIDTELQKCPIKRRLISVQRKLLG